MAQKERYEEQVKKVFEKENPEKVKAAAKKGARYWARLYNALCNKCRVMVVKKTMQRQRNPNSKMWQYKDLCEECQQTTEDFK